MTMRTFTPLVGMFVLNMGLPLNAAQVALWDFDLDLVTDSSPNGWTLMTHGSSVAHVDGVRGKAASFTGGIGTSANDSNVPHLDSILTSAAADYNSGFSIMLWVKLGSLPVGPDAAATLISHHATGLNTASDLFNGFAAAVYGDGSFGFFLDSKTSIAAPNGPLRFRSDPGIIPTDEWIHLAFTWDGSASGGGTLYLNGASVATTITTELSDPFLGLNTTGQLPFRLGAAFIDSSLTFSGFAGVLDHVSVWDDVRTAQQVHDDYIATLPPPSMGIFQAVWLEWPSVLGATYQLQFSTDNVIWTDFGSPIAGTGGVLTYCEKITTVRRFFRATLVDP